MLSDKISGIISPDSNHTGIYLAYPTSQQLKRTYRNHTSLVNDQHTKVGITVKSFRERGSEYMRTFGGEVKFVPLVSMSPHKLAAIEKVLLAALKSEFLTVGRTKEWFNTADRNRIIEIVESVVKDTVEVT